MTLSKKPLKGTRDLFPWLKREKDYMYQVMSHVVESFGYEPYDGPLLEEVDLYKAKSGQELIDEQIYAFYDRAHRHLAIRPEMTPTVARMVSQIYRTHPLPLRWYSFPNLYRYERPQKGRLREHWQFNVDIFAEESVYSEFEILEIIISVMKAFGANKEQFSILINDRRLVDIFFKKNLELDNLQIKALYKILDQAKKRASEETMKDVKALGLSKQKQDLFNEYLNIRDHEQLATFSTKNNIDNLDSLKIFKLAKAQGLTHFLKFDPMIVRGLDYYTGIVFEVFDNNPSNPRALCGGGAYQDLLKIFGEEPISGVGVGIGDVTLGEFLKGHNLMPDFQSAKFDLMLTYQVGEENSLLEMMKLASELRRNKIKVLSTYQETKFRKVIPQALKKGARFVSLVGVDEISQNKISIKNLETKIQKSFDIMESDKIVQFIKGNHEHQS